MGNADYRREFLKLEMAWLYVRFMNLSESSKQTLVNIATRAFVKEFLYDGSLVVPFQYAGAVVGKRLVEFNNGLATVPVKYHFEFVRGHFRDLLLKAMQDAAAPPPEPPFPYPKRYKPPPRDSREDVLLPYMSLEVFQSTRRALISIAQNEQNRLFTIYDVRLPEHPLRLKDMNVALFPPCMRAIVHELEANNHARYGARTQLTIFLRNIGVPYEDAVAFWKKYFLKKMDCDKFNKNYLYYIKHTYGLVGSRFSYRQRDCVHLMKGFLVGCPFKNWSAGQMKKALSEWNPNELTITDIEDIVTESQKTNYQQACALHCTKVHGSMDCGSEIANPCEYYENAKRASGLISLKD